MDRGDRWTIIGTGVALAGVIVAIVVIFNSQFDRFQSTITTMQAEAAADRRAAQAQFDAFRAEATTDRKEFRQEIRALAERQARVEGAISRIAASQVRLPDVSMRVESGRAMRAVERT